MRQLGKYGQWGNSILQSAFMYVASERYDMRLQLPAWAGTHVFRLWEIPVTVHLPQYVEKYKPIKHESCFGEPIMPEPEELANSDFVGWAQHHRAWYTPDKAYIQDLYTVVGEHRECSEKIMEGLRSLGKTVVAFHIRRSDAGRFIFFLTPIVWYLKWLRENWSSLNQPVLYIATEDPDVVKYFTYYQPYTMESFDVIPYHPPKDYHVQHGDKYDHVRQLDFVPDWYVLQNADIVVASDSTFSFSAAWTSRVKQQYYRARLSTQRFELVDPWDADVSWREHVNDYPGIPGTTLDSNPRYAHYWQDHKNKYPAVPENPDEIAMLMTR